MVTAEKYLALELKYGYTYSYVKTYTSGMNWYCETLIFHYYVYVICSELYIDINFM